jgi:uncharacterized Fe-S cluster protein YjdI
MSRDNQREYTNGEVTIFWRPNLCIHSGICFSGLSQVFDPDERPWVNMNGARSQEIIEQVRRCPSGALTTRMNSEIQNNEQ